LWPLGDTRQPEFSAPNASAFHLEAVIRCIPARSSASDPKRTSSVVA
jgi:hypothetical protein